MTLYKVRSELDINTGEITETFTICHIDKALVEPTREVRSFIKDLISVSADVGGFFDPSDRYVIFDRKKDLASDWGDVNLEQFFMIKNRRFDIKAIEEYENNSAIVAMCRETKGQVLSHMCTTISVLSLDHEVANA